MSFGLQLGSFGLYQSNFPGSTPTDFLIKAFTPHYFSLKVPLKVNVTVNLESLIGQSIEQKTDGDLFILRSIEQQDGVALYTVDISKGTKIFLQLKFWVEFDSVGNLTNKIKYKAFLVDEKLWPLKAGFKFPVGLQNSDWKIVIQKEESASNEPKSNPTKLGSAITN